MSTPIARSSSLTESELDLQMQALVKLKEAKPEEKCLCAEEEKKRTEEASKLAAEEAKKAKAVVREAWRAKKWKAAEVAAVKPGPKAKKAKMDEAVGPESSLADILCQQ